MTHPVVPYGCSGGSESAEASPGGGAEMAQIPESYPASEARLLLHPPLSAHAKVRDEGDLRDIGQVPDHAPPAPRLVPEPRLPGMSTLFLKGRRHEIIRLLNGLKGGSTKLINT